MVCIFISALSLFYVDHFVSATTDDIGTTLAEPCAGKSIGNQIDVQGSDDSAFLQIGSKITIQTGNAAFSYPERGPNAEDCVGNWYADLISYDTRLHVTSIPAIRNFTIRRQCVHPFTSNLLEKPDEEHKQWRAHATVVLLAAFGACVLIFLLYMSRTIVWPGIKSQAWVDSISNTRPEQTSWMRSYFHWLAVSWVDPWIHHWGTAPDPSSVTIESSSLGYMGSAGDEANVLSDTLGKLWDEQKLKNTKWDLVLVICRFIGIPRLLFMLTMALVSQGIFFIGPALLIRALVNIIHEIHTRYYADPDSLTLASGFWPTLYVVLLCGIGCTAFLVTDSISYILLTRTNYHVLSALSGLCFRKAQRLSGTNTEFELPSAPGEPPMKYSFVALVNNDVNGGMSTVFQHVFNLIVFCPIMVLLVFIMIETLHKAFMALVITQVIAFACIIIIAIMCAIRTMDCTNYGGLRVAICTEFMQGIRLVKAYGWETAAETMLNSIRANELTALRLYYRWTGYMMFFIFNLPRFMCFTALASYVAWYGSIGAMQIFTLNQLLRQYNNSLQELMMAIPMIARICPSIVRVTHFLHAPEVQATGEETPSPDTGALPMSMQLAPTSLIEPAMPTRKVLARVKGSFRWSPQEPPFLKDIDFEASEGELIAIVGEVGSGKTALLSTLLGELIGCKDAVCTRPAHIAYHAQVPTICEGTLRDNIIFWRGFDEQRYNTVVRQACLARDLDYLPGNDCCSIGNRGVVLSGGQKARVSLARMAYTRDCKFLLCDDPFGSVDMSTGDALLTDLLKGDLLKDTTRVVVCQPDMERLLHFDRVVVMSKGQIVANGTPQDMQQLSCFKELQKSLEDASQSGELRAMRNGQHQQHEPVGHTTSAIVLREEENQGRADKKTLAYFLQLGGTFSFVACILCFGIMTVVFLLADVELAQWGNAQLHGHHHPKTFLFDYGLWVGFAALWWIPTWHCGTSWALNISDSIFHTILGQLLRAPVDAFYDRTPTGRILNRISGDLQAIDMQTFIKSTATICMIFWFFIPLIYIHVSLPLWFLGVSLPIYALMYVMIRRYWNLIVPLRYLTVTTRSKLSSYMNEVSHHRTTFRIYGVCEQISVEQSAAVDAAIKSEFAVSMARRWMIFRFNAMYSFFLTAITLIAIWFPTAMTVGTASLCMTYMISLSADMETNLENASALQFEFINMNRIHEYTDLPQEREAIQANDNRYTNVFVRVKRGDLGNLQTVFLAKEGHVGIMRDKKVLLQSMDGESFVLGHQEEGDGGAASWKEVVLNHGDYPKLANVEKWHRLVAIGVDGNTAQSMGEALSTGKETELTLCFQPEYLANGARVDIRQLRAGYTQYPDTLHGITFEIPERSKTAIMGPSGCGKSTFLQSLLRLIEPRSGSISINGVNTQAMGLDTLRTTLGLVPQDPVLFSGTVSQNLDPFEEQTDDRLWKSLEAVSLAEHLLLSLFPSQKEEIEAKRYSPRLFKACLDLQIKADGENFSFGQRQLLCIARMMLRQPAVLLLDECTSAIDPRTQKNVQDAIREGFPNATVISVAHRLETIMDFEQVVVFDKGRVKHVGSPQEFNTVDELMEWAATKPEEAAKSVEEPQTAKPPPEAAKLASEPQAPDVPREEKPAAEAEPIEESKAAEVPNEEKPAAEPGSTEESKVAAESQAEETAKDEVKAAEEPKVTDVSGQDKPGPAAEATAEPMQAAEQQTAEPPLEEAHHGGGDAEIKANVEATNGLLGKNAGKTEKNRSASDQPTQSPTIQSFLRQSDEYFKVVGATRGDGILVRLAEETSSKAFPEPLGTGSIIRVVQWGRAPGRVYYEKLNGIGPSFGWVSMKVKDTNLLEPYHGEITLAGDMTKQQALSLQQELRAKYAAVTFQKDLRQISEDYGFNTPQYRQARQKLVLGVQKTVLPKHGFEASDQGVAKMRKAINALPEDPDIQANIMAINNLLNVHATE